ncbi:MAG: cyclopropane-fatty-acyl-phospholipid synthase [Alphaproteobacteria bacterium BRH_c36]|nr:MAG: cyclopropane-fatty-acyl-phospholipid synthase [Alphaproteobacteria bacterium BRH_c36]
MLLSWQLQRFIETGWLRVTYPTGQTTSYGDGSTPVAGVTLKEQSVLLKLVTDPYVALGEAYMDGSLIVENDDLYGLLALLQQNLLQRSESLPASGLSLLRRHMRGLKQTNTRRGAQANVAHHYDLSSELYDLFLDQDRQYSCAYFRNPDDTLEAAQRNKKELIATKLLLKPDHRVLDIGCGFGGLGLHLAREHGSKVTGVTLSKEQLSVAEQRARQERLETRAQFELMDYREVAGQFDRIVSVGMFEHVGIPQYTQFFDTIRNRLADDGVALLHTIGRADGPGVTDPWIEKYIFPGGYSPALSEILSVIEQSGLYVTDIEVWRLHYAETLKAWRTRFEANLDRVKDLYDDRFSRMWRYYLVASELAFRHNGHVVFQIQLAKRQYAVPLTRDYLAEVTNPNMLSMKSHHTASIAAA